MIYPVPEWYSVFRNNWRTENFHQFLFDGNIYDSFFWPSSNELSQWDVGGKEGVLYPFNEFLIRSLLRGFDIVFYYSQSMGIIPYTKKSESFLPFSHKDCSKSDGSSSESVDPEDLLKNLERECERDKKNSTIPSTINSIQDVCLYNIKLLGKALRETRDDKESGKSLTVAVIIDSLDNIFSENNDITQRFMAEMILGWGMDRNIASSQNISILIAEDREHLPGPFRTENRGTFSIDVSQPESGYRKLYFMDSQIKSDSSSLMKVYMDADSHRVDVLTQLTRGFRINDCERLRKISDKADDVLCSKFFFEKDHPEPEDFLHLVQNSKKDVISTLSRGLLQPIDTTIGFEDIGGLDGVIEYFHNASEAIIRKDEDDKWLKIIPKGVLLAGPPGTGKSLLARALSNESGVSIVTMGNIRSMWVGESERNLTNALKLLKSMAPVIVFIDEIDQAIGSRSSQSGDSGVSGRIFGKILEFMGNNDNRGDVIWIAATNRTDLLDDAMLRRFDRIIPVLLPGSTDEWHSVSKGICNQIEVDLSSEVQKDFIDNNINFLRKNYSGSSMEQLVRNAAEYAIADNDRSLIADDLVKVFGEFKTNFNYKQYELQTLLALSACNKLEFIPPPSESYSYGSDELDKIVLETIESRSNNPLLNRISELKRDISFERI